MNIIEKIIQKFGCKHKHKITQCENNNKKGNYIPVVPD